MGTAVFVIVVLALLAKSGGTTTPEQQPPPSPEDTGGGAAQDLLDTGGKLLGAGLGLVGTLGGGAGALATTGGAAGTVALGGGGGALGGTALPGSAAAAVGGGGGTTTVASTTTTATALAGSVEGAIGACGITLIVVIIVICNEIAKAQAEEKSFQSRLLAFLPNARDMHSFERAIVAESVRFQVQKWEEADFRLDRRDEGNKIVMRGFRTVMRWPPPPPGALPPYNLPRLARAMAYAYLRERNRRGRFLNANWVNLNVPVWKDADQDMAFREAMNKASVFGQEGMEDPSIGGLASVPLINGFTVVPRGDKSDRHPATAELVARVQDRNVDEAEIPEVDRKRCRLLGLLDAIKLFQFDPTVYVAFDGREYRDTMYSRLGLTASEATKITMRDPSATNQERHGFVLSAEEFGTSLFVDAVRVKSGLWGLAGVGVANPSQQPALVVLA